MNTPQDAFNVVMNVCRKALLSADERELCTRALDAVAVRMNRAHELEQAAAPAVPAVPAHEVPAPAPPPPDFKKQMEEAIATANAAAKRLAELTATVAPAPAPVAPPES